MNASAASLSGIRILDCSTSLAASHCCELLLGLGAEVIKVEDPAGGEESRARGPFLEDISGPDRSLLFHYVNGGKQGVTLNLRTRRGQALLSELARTAAVLVEDLPASAVAECGLTAAALHDANPRLIVASITPFGRSGPHAGYLATDLILAHAGGFAYATPGLVADPPSQPPLRPGSYQASFAAAVAAAINIAAAVLAAEQDPEGTERCQIDFSCQEALINLFRQSMGSYGFHGTGLGRNLAKGRGAGGMADGRSLRCKDGHVQILWGRWEPLKKALGNPGWMDDPRVSTAGARYYEWDFIESHLTAWTSQYGKQEIFHLLQREGVPCAPVNTGSDLLASEALAARGFWHEVDLTAADRLRVPGPLAHLSATPWAEKSRGPALGEHNAQVYGGLLNLTDGQCAELAAAGVV